MLVFYGQNQLHCEKSGFIHAGFMETKIKCALVMETIVLGRQEVEISWDSTDKLGKDTD